MTSRALSEQGKGKRFDPQTTRFLESTQSRLGTGGLLKLSVKATEANGNCPTRLSKSKGDGSKIRTIPQDLAKVKATEVKYELSHKTWQK
ncbi:hypothetical protein PoB_002425000 [Plakobranchus ocellatus]|uniref:Uncharacterized protein n=1 Tax=Plakobranchus ocellatus TaxID=259542 RepID=A0AAV3ZPU7_9GAST|nr:hypothetical protein PoB_002425000 [Plakobranchus ocellatus]